MGFLARLFGGGGRSADAGDRDGIHVFVRCDKCGEKVHARANRNTDISQEYADGGQRATPTLHKEILGSRCQNLMYVHLTFDASFRVVTSSGERCKVMSREEYEAD